MTALATSYELALALGYTFNSADHDRADKLLDMASAEICGPGAANSPILEETTTERLDSDGSRTLLLRHRFVSAVTSVKADGVTVPADGYEWSESGVLWRLGTTWPVGFQAVEVTYTHGFVYPPADVHAICLAYAARLFRNIEGDQQRRRGDASTAFASSADEAVGLRKSELDTLRRYRPNANGAIG